MPIELTERFVRQYRKLPRTIQQKVDKALALLNADFRHPGRCSHPVENTPGIFEAYVDRKYRMTFERRSDTFIMRNVDNHDECLRNP
jgi:mRNA-degrading endonuclease RelE of RelBE toxin-antitoxin system